MRTLKKYVLIKILEIAKEKGLNTIDELIIDINKHCKNNTDVVFSWKFDKNNHNNDESVGGESNESN
mgnify:CR=1 FL=1|jgi:hypothetical protein